MENIKLVISLIFVSLLLTVNAQETNNESNDDCIFDMERQTDSFIKKIPEFSKYTWDTTKKEATIELANGNTLLATRGGCDHFAVYGKLIFKNSNLSINQEEEIFKEALWIAKKLFDKSDYELFSMLLQEKKYKIEVIDLNTYYTFSQKLYCNAILRIEKRENKVIAIEIGYYIC